MSGTEQRVRPTLPGGVAAGCVVRPAVLNDLLQVTWLAKLESNRVGFIPSGGLTQYVMEGWTAVALAPDAGVVGYILGRPSLRYARWCRPVTQLVTRPDHRRQGIATALVAWLMAQAMADGRHCVQAWSREDLPANALWDRLGWTVVADRQPATARQRPSLLWRCPLTAEGLLKIGDLPPVGGFKAQRQQVQGLFIDWRSRQG